MKYLLTILSILISLSVTASLNIDSIDNESPMQNTHTMQMDEEHQMNHCQTNCEVNCVAHIALQNNILIQIYTILSPVVVNAKIIPLYNSLILKVNTPPPTV